MKMPRKWSKRLKTSGWSDERVAYFENLCKGMQKSDSHKMRKTIKLLTKINFKD